MKRLALLCAIAVPLFGLTRPVAPGSRIGMLRVSDPFAWDKLAQTIGSDLREELHSRGFDSFDTGMTFDELQHRELVRADYFVEVAWSSHDGREHGTVGAALGPAAVGLAIETWQVEAEVRLYDGRTLQLLNVYHPQRKQTTAYPAGIGIANHFAWASFALPFIRDQQLRSRAHEVARHAADLIAGR